MSKGSSSGHPGPPASSRRSSDAVTPARFAQRVAEIADTVTVALDELLPRAEGPESRLTEAMRYAALGPGKRLRPFFADRDRPDVRPEGAGVLRAACALECVHAYSLVHDDLPCMDDDDLRRGRPTVHSAYDEATAVLAGDALQTVPSRSWPTRTPTRTAPYGPSWCAAWRSRRAHGAWPAAR